jgi:hypothetical protein
MISKSEVLCMREKSLRLELAAFIVKHKKVEYVWNILCYYGPDILGALSTVIMFLISEYCILWLLAWTGMVFHLG